jgi:soluble lytic murein transglycosylase
LALCAVALAWSPLATEPPGGLPPVALGPPSEAAAAPDVREIRARLEPYRTGLASFELDALAATIARESRSHGLSASLVLGVIQIESGYNNFAVSHRGAMGLMQIMPATGEGLSRELGLPWHGPQTLFDPEANVRLGIAYLAQLRSQYGNLATALAAYNWGPGRISSRLRRGSPVPQVYARNVIDAYGSHAARLETPPAALSDSTSVPTRAAANASTASMAASSLLR